MTRTKVAWSFEYLVDAYILAKQGMADTKIAHHLGTNTDKFGAWRKKYPELQRVLDRARTPTKDGGDKETFTEYVHRHLPEKLVPLWEKIMFWSENERTSIEQINGFFKGYNVETRQRIFIHALVQFNFSYSKALAATGLTRTQVNEWHLNDTNFPAMMKEIEWHKKNFFEDKYIDLVNMYHPAAVIHANRTFNRDRGYGNQVTVKHVGQVNVNVNVVSIERLKLPLETRKVIRDAIRATQLSLTPTAAPVTVNTQKSPESAPTPLELEIMSEAEEGTEEE